MLKAEQSGAKRSKAEQSGPITKPLWNGAGQQKLVPAKHKKWYIRKIKLPQKFRATQYINSSIVQLALVGNFTTLYDSGIE